MPKSTKLSAIIEISSVSYTFNILASLFRFQLFILYQENTLVLHRFSSIFVDIVLLVSHNQIDKKHDS